jgi:hypothetical protein
MISSFFHQYTLRSAVIFQKFSFLITLARHATHVDGERSERDPEKDQENHFKSNRFMCYTFRSPHLLLPTSLNVQPLQDFRGRFLGFETSNRNNDYHNTIFIPLSSRTSTSFGALESKIHRPGAHCGKSLPRRKKSFIRARIKPNPFRKFPNRTTIIN